jgi:hypothetical protein
MEAWQPGHRRDARPGVSGAEHAAHRTGRMTSAAKRSQWIMASAVRGVAPLWGQSGPDARDGSDA